MSESVIGALRVNLGINTAVFREGLADATSALKKTGQPLQSIGKTMSLAVSAPLIGFGTVALRTAGDFEAAMNQVGAVSGATGAQLEELREVAKQLGATTQFSASEAADAMKFLSMAGFDANQTAEALPGTLDLAAAAATSLGDAADIVSNVLSGYGKEVGELAHVNDVLVKTFTSTNTDLRQLGEAMKYAAPIASAAGVDFEEAAAAIGMMGNAGIQGSEAGTALRGAMSRLLNPTDAVAGALEEVGVTVTDAEGRLKPFTEIVAALEPYADDAARMLRIFGQEAGPAMTALISQGSDSLRSLTAELENSGGTAERIANAQMQGFNGAMKEMASAFEAVQIAFAETGFLDTLAEAMRGLAEGMRTGIEAFKGLSPEMQNFLKITAVGLAAGGPVLIGLGLLATALGAISLPAVAVGTGIAAVTAALVAFWPEIKAGAAIIGDFAADLVETIEAIPETFRQMKDDVLRHVREMVDGIAEWFGNSQLGRAVSTVTDAFSSVTGAARQMWSDVVGNSWVPDMVLGVESWMGRLAASMPDMATTATAQVSSAFEGVASIVGDTMRSAADSVARGTFKMKDLLRGLAVDLARSGLNALAGAAGGALSSALRTAFSSTAAPAGWTAATASSFTLPQLANGTPFARGGPTIVGERGIELVDMPRGARVHTNAETRRMLGGGDGKLQVEVVMGAGLEGRVSEIAEGVSVRVVNQSTQGPQFAARVAAANRTATNSRMR